MKRKIITGILIASFFTLIVSLNVVHALPNQIWVGSAVSGGWQSIPEARVPLVDIEVQIDIRPRMLYTESEGIYSVFVKFPEEYDYGKELGDIGGETIILQFNTRELDLEGFETGDAVVLIIEGELIDGTSFLGSMNASYVDGHVKIIQNIYPYPTDP